MCIKSNNIEDLTNQTIPSTYQIKSKVEKQKKVVDQWQNIMFFQLIVSENKNKKYVKLYKT